jgi:hypothetical protein
VPPPDIVTFQTPTRSHIFTRASNLEQELIYLSIFRRGQELMKSLIYIVLQAKPEHAYEILYR